MLQILIIFSLGLTPPLLSIWNRQRSEARTRLRLRRAMKLAGEQEIRNLERRLNEQTFEKNLTLIGDVSCQFNAHSIYIRCAVNPLGPCENCQSYQTHPSQLN